MRVDFPSRDYELAMTVLHAWIRKTLRAGVCRLHRPSKCRHLLLNIIGFRITLQHQAWKNSQTTGVRTGVSGRAHQTSGACLRRWTRPQFDRAYPWKNHRLIDILSRRLQVHRGFLAKIPKKTFQQMSSLKQGRGY